MKLGFAQAVRDRGDEWLHAIKSSGLHAAPNDPQISAATWCDMRERDPEYKDAMRMRLCEQYSHDEHLFQVERPTYRCGCRGLCERYPDCAGAVYEKDFPYQRDQRTSA